MVERENVNSKKAPAAIGPYSQGVKIGQLLFTSGQIPLDPKTNELVEGDIRIQTKQVIENVKVILESAGTSMENTVKTMLFLTDMGEFPLVNEVYSQYFERELPARSCVEVSHLPRDAKIEIEAVAFIPRGKLLKASQKYG
mgnify:CR=1 FL=1